MGSLTARSDTTQGPEHQPILPAGYVARPLYLVFMWLLVALVAAWFFFMFAKFPRTNAFLDDVLQTFGISQIEAGVGCVAAYVGYRIGHDLQSGGHIDFEPVSWGLGAALVTGIVLAVRHRATASRSSLVSNLNWRPLQRLIVAFAVLGIGGGVVGFLVP